MTPAFLVPGGLWLLLRFVVPLAFLLAISFGYTDDLGEAVYGTRLDGSRLCAPDALRTPRAVEAERLRAERLVTRGRRRVWLAYLQEARELAERSAGNGVVREARAVVLDVLDNHDSLTLGLPSRRFGGPR